ncbi:hypothetical protein [Streptomyces sp. NBC_00009]|uniref:hypothetical protein n=1 Tax=Streptomyces sp. NBC_00009 TaxID=2975620 RepID=UPI003248AF60
MAHVDRGRHWLRSARTVLADSQARRSAEERRASREPVLAAPRVAVGIWENPAEARKGLTGAPRSRCAGRRRRRGEVTQLEAVRLRRDVENAAFDNVLRG